MFQMPDVNPSGSAPPVSGKLEDPSSLPKRRQSDERVKPSDVNSTGTSSDTDQTSEVNRRPTGSSTDDLIAHETVLTKSSQEVIKDISISSTNFIGPVCRPQVTIEDELSHFYKELEQIDHQDNVNEDNVNERVPPACIPTVKSSSRNDHQNAYRPYPQVNSPAAYRRNDGNTQVQRWTHDMTNVDGGYLSASPRWQPLLPWPPHGPPSFQFQDPQPVFSIQPHNHFVPHLHFESRVTHLRHSESSRWRSWEGTQFSTDERSDLIKRYGSNNSDRQDYNGYHGNHQQLNSDNVLILMRGLPGSGKSTLAK